jgi:tetratricopeptide (TPR) repeat protein
MLARRYDAALEEARQRLESHPREIILQYLIADTYRRAGRDKEAEDALEQASVNSGNTAYAVKARAAFRSGGFKGIVREDLADALRKSKSSYQSPVDLALYYAELGDREKALTELEEAYRQHLPQILWIQSDPAFDFLHADPRYRSLIQRIGLPPA